MPAAQITHSLPPFATMQSYIPHIRTASRRERSSLKPNLSQAEAMLLLTGRDFKGCVAVTVSLFFVEGVNSAQSSLTVISSTAACACNIPCCFLPAHRFCPVSSSGDLTLSPQYFVIFAGKLQHCEGTVGKTISFRNTAASKKCHQVMSPCIVPAVLQVAFQRI